MTDRRIEGTFYLDGLLEGPILSADDERYVRTFVAQAGRAGLKFDVAFNAGRFSLLADNKLVQVQPGEEPADARMGKCLDQFLNGYSSQEYARLMSTLRSVEYIPGHEVQTIYGIKPDGTVAVQQRTVRADTIQPAKPPDFRDKVNLATGAGLVLLALIGLSAFFVPYRDIAVRLIRQVKPFNTQELTINAGPYAQFFSVETVDLDRGQGIIWITCKVMETYPQTEDKMNELWKSSADSAIQRLAIEALMRHSLRCEFFDWEGTFRGQQLCYMHWSDDDKGQFRIAIPFRRDLGRVNVSF